LWNCTSSINSYCCIKYSLKISVFAVASNTLTLEKYFTTSKNHVIADDQTGKWLWKYMRIGTENQKHQETKILIGCVIYGAWGDLRWSFCLVCSWKKMLNRVSVSISTCLLGQIGVLILSCQGDIWVVFRTAWIHAYQILQL